MRLEFFGVSRKDAESQAIVEGLGEVDDLSLSRFNFEDPMLEQGHEEVEDVGFTPPIKGLNPGQQYRKSNVRNLGEQNKSKFGNWDGNR